MKKLFFLLLIAAFVFYAAWLRNFDFAKHSAQCSFIFILSLFIAALTYIFVNLLNHKETKP